MTDKPYAELAAENLRMKGAIRTSVIRADDHADSYISGPIRDCLSKPETDRLVRRIEALEKVAYMFEGYSMYPIRNDFKEVQKALAELKALEDEK